MINQFGATTQYSKLCRAVGRSENPKGRVIMWWGGLNLSPGWNIGLTVVKDQNHCFDPKPKKADSITIQP